MEKRIRSCESDRISGLPEKVTDNILSFLPLREAARTTILSTKWRYGWINLSKLAFDDTSYPFSDNEPLARYKLISTSNHILLLHDGPIHKFSLSHSLLESCPDIDHFTSFLSKKRVHEFSLEIIYGEEHKLHSSFFSFQELTHLCLSNCIFTPPSSFNGFRSMVSLKFENVVFFTDKFDNFISSCPQLESLTLIEPPKFHRLAISAPNLKYLHFEGDCDFLCFGEVPHLQSVLFDIDSMSLQKGKAYGLVEFFCSLPVLKKLVANQLLIKLLAVGGVPKKLPTSISLETLKLSEISFYALDEVSSILCLISSCSSLQRIEIEVCYGDNGDDGDDDNEGNADKVVDFFNAQDCSTEIILNELRLVHLLDVTGTEPELEFIKLLLAKSPVLETMLIQPKLKDIFSSFELLTKLTKFKRASSIAEIVFE